MIDRHPTTAHAAYNDLVRSLLDDTVSDIRGTPTRVERSGRVYWYDTYRVGADVRKRYIGEDSEDLRKRIEKHGILKKQTDGRRRYRARLVRMLRAERFLGSDSTTGSLLRAMAMAGVFRLGGTVVGTHAFRLYEGELGVRFTFDQMAATDDIDIASFERLSLALGEAISPPLESVLSDFSFDPVPSTEGGKVWRWKQTQNDLLVEFLTPSFDEKEGLRHLAALGVDAQSLHHLNYLIAEPIDAAVLYRDGVLVRIPRPERFAIHKLIVADRRRRGPDRRSVIKDRLQAEFLIEILAEDRPDDLKDAYEDAMDRGPKWRERLERSLELCPGASSRLRNLP